MLSALRKLYGEDLTAYAQLLCSARAQLKDTAAACQVACQQKNAASFGDLSHKAQGFLRIINHKPLLRALSDIHKELIAKKDTISHSKLKIMFEDLLQALKSEQESL